MTWNPRKLFRQLFTETDEEGIVQLNTARLWINFYALLGAVGIILNYIAVAMNVYGATLGVSAGFVFNLGVLHLMAWRAQKDRKAEHLKGSLQSSAQAMGQASASGAALSSSHLPYVGRKGDNERG